MILLGTVLLMVYIMVLFVLMVGYLRLEWVYAAESTAVNGFSIIIPFRNEALHLPQLTATLKQLQYPLDKFELIFVNDDSEDDSEILISEALGDAALNWKLVQNNRVSKAPKKDAIVVGIQHSRYDWIVTTDADCKIPATWLSAIDGLIQTKIPKMICGPVVVEGDTSLAAAFQKYETLSLQGIAMAGSGLSRPLLCNGANLAYSKAAFYEVDGFKGNDNIASGDDIFLMEKMWRQFPKEVVYLKSRRAIVLTAAEGSWKNVLRQRVRWAAKTSKQPNLLVKLIGLVVLIANLWFVPGLVWMLMYVEDVSLLYLNSLLVKVAADIIFVLAMNNFFRTKINAGLLFFNALFYPFISSAIALRSLFGHYHWKGRHFNR